MTTTARSTSWVTTRNSTVCGTRANCFSYVDENRTDVRAKNLREVMTPQQIQPRFARQPCSLCAKLRQNVGNGGPAEKIRDL